MFQLREPRERDLKRFLAAMATSPLSYVDVGIASQSAPVGYRLDTAEVLLGTGEAAFRSAVMALQSWKMFDLGWVQAMPSAAPIAPSVNVAVTVHHLGFWSLNGCRVVYIVPSTEGATERYGFAARRLPAYCAQRY